MTSHLANGGLNGTAHHGVSLQDIPKSVVFTSHLPPDPQFPTPQDSHSAARAKLGPRRVNNALFTYVRPEHAKDSDLVSVSPAAMRDIGLAEGEEKTEMFADMVSGNRIVGWDEERKEGVYPWAQCYGGWQFGQWAGQLGDGRAISLFETTNLYTKTRYEIQLKGAGRTPYSRFADGKAVVRSSIREYIVSEALNALKIPSTRALSLTLLPKAEVYRERVEPGAIVARFAQSWLRIGTFDLLRSRGDRRLVRQLATYAAEHVLGGWEALPARIPEDTIATGSTEAVTPARNVTVSTVEGTSSEFQENRFARLYREICRRNAKTVAAWQAYGFMNGVLNTDNTSLFGLSLDFGPFAFLDVFDPNYTPNHDDHMLRYAYKNQPSVIWWNLIRLGEDLGELLGAGDRVDEEQFVTQGVTEEYAPLLIKRAENIIDRAGDEYRAVFMAEYKRLMAARLGLQTVQDGDFEKLYSELLDTMEALELDFHHFFRRLSNVKMVEVESEEHRRDVAGRFFHAEGVTGADYTDESARERIAKWLAAWRERIMEDWQADQQSQDDLRRASMKSVNPKFVPRGWVLDELIQRVEKKGERQVLDRVMNMALHPFEDDWGGTEEEREEAERWCGDVPRLSRGMQCSCSS